MERRRMGQLDSKDEQLFQLVSSGNIKGIKALRHEGAGLEWFDGDGKNPLIVACMNPDLIYVAETLLELGANVNAYGRGKHDGTPLHHAAKRGLDQTVKLLLCHGANVFLSNKDGHTPFLIARVNGYTNVVREIESRICLFSGWLRVSCASGFVEALVPQWVSKKMCWVVVKPCVSHDHTETLNLVIAIYSSGQDAHPRDVIELQKAKVEEPKFNQSDPTVIIFNKATKTRHKFASANEGDHEQLQLFLDACRKIPEKKTLGVTTQMGAEEDRELAKLITAYIESAMEVKPPLLPDSQRISGASKTDNSLSSLTDNPSPKGPCPIEVPIRIPPREASCSEQIDKLPKDSHKSWGTFEVGSSSNRTSKSNIHPPVLPMTQEKPVPTVDIKSIDLSTLVIAEKNPVRTRAVKEKKGGDSSCVVCFDAPIEGACIPCGHMAGCMSCLNEIKVKKWDCPVCRTKIDNVLKLYAV